MSTPMPKTSAAVRKESKMLTDAQNHILKHALGLTRSKESYRNRFLTEPETVDWPVCQELVALGLMAPRTLDADFGGMTCFMVTEAGRAALAAKGNGQ